MANVTTVTRSNRFACKDPDEVCLALSQCRTDGNPVVATQENGKIMFYCEGEIEGMLTPKAREMEAKNPGWCDDHPEEAYTMSQLCTYLMEHLSADDACCILSTGRESMRDIWADCYVVTWTSVKHVDLRQVAQSVTREALMDPKWELKL